MLESLGNAFDSFTSSVGGIFSSGLDGIIGILESVIDGIDYVFNAVVNVGTYIVSGCANIVSSIADGIADVISSIADGIADVISSIADGIADLIVTILDIPQMLIDLLSELFEFLFIPEFNPLDDIQDEINDKFYLLSQIWDIATNLFSDYGEAPPAFTIDYAGSTLDIINLSFYDDYRDFIHSIIIGVMGVRLVIWIIRHASSVVKGGG